MSHSSSGLGGPVLSRETRVRISYEIPKRRLGDTSELLQLAGIVPIPSRECRSLPENKRRISFLKKIITRVMYCSLAVPETSISSSAYVERVEISLGFP